MTVIGSRFTLGYAGPVEQDEHGAKCETSADLYAHQRAQSVSDDGLVSCNFLIRRMPSDIQDHPDWVDGDFTLISSDGWRFKVHTWSLCWSR